MLTIRRHWPLALLLAGALALRVTGIDHGLPYSYNADENAHFVPRAIGFFGQSLNPGYFINPPAYTYLLHVVFAAAYGGATGTYDTFASDPGSVFTLARLVAAVLGTLAVGLLWGAARVWSGDARVAYVAAGVLAVGFLPVFYSKLALNDVPTLAPLCLALLGVALAHRRGRACDYALAGAGLGLACATKYTAGIVLVSLLVVGWREPLKLALAGLVALAGFLVANPFALLDFDAFYEGLNRQSTASGEDQGKLGLTEDNGWLYYLKAIGWGLGVAPALAALAAVPVLWRGRERTALLALLVPVALFVAFMGAQERFFGRWVMPVLPFVALLGAWGAVALAARVRRRPAVAVAGLALVAQGLVLSLHSSVVLTREDTRNLARAWLVANVPEGTKVVVEPVFPDQWAQDVGDPSPATSNGNRWIKWRTSRSRVNDDGTLRRGRGRIVNVEDYERTTRPELLDAYVRGGFCWLVTGSTQYGRAYAEPQTVPRAIEYYAELRRRGELVHRVEPWSEPVPFSFDWSFTYLPLAYERPGPEILVYRLRGGDCGG